MHGPVEKIDGKITPAPTEALLTEVEKREADPKRPKREKTGGEKLFNRTVYTGIGFFVNEGISLWATDQFVYGKPKWYLGGKWFSQEGFEAVSGKIAKSFKWTPDKAKNSLLMALLLSGGTLLVWPMKKLEDHKLYCVEKGNHFLDWMRGSARNEEETAARDAEVKKAVACESEQTWTSILVGRAGAMLVPWSTGTFLVGKKNNDRIKNFAERLFTFGGSVQPEGKKTMGHRYAALAGVETYSCLLGSITMEIVSKLFAKRGLEVHDPEICTAVTHENNGNGGSGTAAASSGQPTDKKAQVIPLAAPSACAAAPADKLNQYKRTVIAPVGKHADHAAREPHYALAP